MKKSYLATGEQDSIDHYIEMFSNKYPRLNFSDYDYYSSVILHEEISKAVEIVKDSIEVKEIEFVPEKIKLGEKPWVIQVGAFREIKNAEVIAGRLESAGFSVEVIEKVSRINLFLVQVVRFATIEKAINIGEKVNDQFGLEFRIIERN